MWGDMEDDRGGSSIDVDTEREVTEVEPDDVGLTGGDRLALRLSIRSLRYEFPSMFISMNELVEAEEDG